VAALNGATELEDGIAREVQRQLAALVQPSALRGIAVEHPQVELARVIAAEHVTAALERLLFLCHHHTAVDSAGRVGVKALLTGPSGTGKTLAARAIANSLGRPLYRIDLSAVVSKWVGETEKNLRTALAAAELAGAVLLFDEGDALFGKRGEVSKGTDRYANIEVSYLLQAIEAFDGIAVVTSNLRSNIDEAFERRFDVAIEFTAPSRRERALIWRQELGDEGKALPESVVQDVARRAELTGGGIAAASRLARVLARERGETMVSEEDMRVSVHSEFLKMGSTVQAAQWVVSARGA
jgi:SpoVK/Ycf46/Vps4 family AAA+-type ATPase